MNEVNDWVSTTTADVLISFASRESATVEEVLSLARQLQPIFTELSNQAASRDTAPVGGLVPMPVPAVSIEASVTDDAVVCLCCGKSFTMLKRHLKAEHGMTEGEYREAFGLTEDHPLTAPSYSKRKADYAKQIGLGKHAREDVGAGRPGMAI